MTGPQDKKKRAPATATADEEPEAPDWSKGLLALAGTLVVGVLAAVGVTGDLLARMVRNEPFQIIGPLVFLLGVGGIVGIVFAWRAQARIVAVATAAAAFSLCYLASMGAFSQDDRELPSVQLHLERADSGWQVSATATGTTLKSSEKMLLQVIELPDPIEDYHVLEAVCQDARNRVDADYDGDVRLLAWTEVGPDAKGVASTGVTIPIAGDPKGMHYCALAQLVHRDETEPQLAWSVVEAPTAPTEPTDPGDVPTTD